MTKNFPATRAGTSRPLAISVRSNATEMGSLPAKTATASSSRMGSSSPQSSGRGRAAIRSPADMGLPARDRHRRHGDDREGRMGRSVREGNSHDQRHDPTIDRADSAATGRREKAKSGNVKKDRCRLRWAARRRGSAWTVAKSLHDPLKAHHDSPRQTHDRDHHEIVQTGQKAGLLNQLPRKLSDRRRASLARREVGGKRG